MRVLAVIPRAVEWKAAMFTRQMQAVADQGCDVKLFFLSSRTHLGEVVRERQRLRREIHEFRPDVVHAHFGTMTAFFSVTATRVPVVISFRGSDLNPAGPDDNQLRLAISHLLSHAACFGATRIICVSEQLRGRLLVKRSKATVIPTGVDLTLFRPMPQAIARQRLGWSLQERVVLFAAGVTERNKGGGLVRQSMEIARARVPNLRLEVMDGRTRPDDVPWLMNGSDCLAFASQYEGSPNVVKEAIACNLPVVSVDVGDVLERLAGVSPSSIVDRDPDAMGRALAERLEHPVRSDGHDSIRPLSKEAVAARILDVYTQCMTERRKAPL